MKQLSGKGTLHERRNSKILSRAGEPDPGVFGSLEPEPLERKKQEPEPLGKKKSGA